ncbi:MAG TPA: amino acid ABC transporter permease [Acidimicrobiia bacterium]|nr:amino acid ABC transporter permease [Acidimicrobiia bacterium]
MTQQEAEPATPEPVAPPGPGATAYTFEARGFPWWLVGMLLIIAGMVLAVVFNDAYREAFVSIFPVPPRILDGIAMTFYLTLGAFVVATFLGLFIGLARISRNPWLSNGAALYIEFIRGIPMIVFIFAVAFFIAPDFADLINVPSRAIPQAVRGGAALSLFYAAFIAEVFRAGIQSVGSTQTQAGRALGLSETQIMRRVVLPQAMRNMLPALGNDLIALMKDTSLVSVLAVRELTQMARIYSGFTFRFRESFLILMVIYVVLTLGLSLLLRWYEQRISIPGY